MLGITTVEIFKNCTGLHVDKEKCVTKVEKKSQKCTLKGNWNSVVLDFPVLLDSLARELRYRLIMQLMFYKSGWN